MQLIDEFHADVVSSIFSLGKGLWGNYLYLWEMQDKIYVFEYF